MRRMEKKNERYRVQSHDAHTSENRKHKPSHTSETKKPYDTKDSQVVPHSILIRPIEA